MRPASAKLTLQRARLALFLGLAELGQNLVIGFRLARERTAIIAAAGLRSWRPFLPGLSRLGLGPWRLLVRGLLIGWWLRARRLLVRRLALGRLLIGSRARVQKRGQSRQRAFRLELRPGGRRERQKDGERHDQFAHA